MNVKGLKIIVSFLLLVGLIMMGSHNVFAARDPAEIIVPHSVDGDEELEGIGEEVLGIVTVVGYAMAVIISIIVGIKYMTGSVEEKAGYKKSMMPYIIGCVVLVAAPTITNIVYDLSKPLKASKVIKKQMCYICMHFEEEQCSHITNGYGPGLKPGYCCTGCDVRFWSDTCPKCGDTYKGD